MLLSSDTAVTGNESTSSVQPGETGGFFTVDHRCWARVCALGIDAAVAYLVLARGSGRDNRTTGWSVRAIEDYTGISRNTAKVAIGRLKAAGLIDQIVEGTRPRYILKPAHEVPGTTAYPRQAIFTGERAAYDRICENGRLTIAEKKAVPHLIAKGWVVDHLGGDYQALPPPSVDPEPIWLPNQLVSGAANENSPIERVRQTRDPLTLRLLVDLYHYHDLAGSGGVDPSYMRQDYHRIRVSEYGEYVVWAFAPEHERMFWTPLSLPHRTDPTPEQRAEGVGAWSRWYHRTRCLIDLGVVRWIPHLWEGDDPGAAPLHPYALGGGHGSADLLGAAAHAAGRAMITDAQFQEACDKLGGEAWLAPVLRHIDNVQMIGVARLLYRPHTKLTSAWIAQLTKSTKSHLDDYRVLAARVRRRTVGI